MIDCKQNSPLCLNNVQNKGDFKGNPIQRLGLEGVNKNYWLMVMRSYDESLWRFEEKRGILESERPLGREERRLLDSVRAMAEKNRPTMAQILTA